jgi:ATP-dependent Clp protease ATP-binding subunit ClpC
MFERFTDNARGVVVKAQSEARDLKHDYIGTEHVLLGLFHSPNGIAAQALSQLAITAEMVRADVVTMVGVGTESLSGHIPFSGRAKKVLELALREALQLSHNYIGTEHILLALVREGNGAAAKVLAKHVEDVQDIPRTVSALIESHTKGGGPVRPNRTTAADEVVTAAEALAGAAPMGSHHLLEALIRADGSMAATVLAQLGVSPDAIADKVDELDADATTDATPQETAARKMEIRVVDDEVHVVFRDDSTLGLAKSVTELTGDASIRAAGPLAGRFVPLWTQLNELLLDMVRTLKPGAEAEGRDLGKATLLVRRVLHDRLRRRQPPDQSSAGDAGQ